jgi:iron complex outermembrane receptor protein
LESKFVGITDSFGYRPALEKNYGSLSGSFGIIYSISEELLLRTNVAAAYRTPNLAELTSNGQHETRFEVGESNLVPENSYEADISTHYHLDNLTLDIAGFYNIINHYIFISPTGHNTESGIPVYKYMQQNSVLLGGEVGLHIHPRFLKWFHTETTYSHVTGIQINGDYLPFVPADKLNIEIRLEKEKFSFLESAYLSVNSNTAFNQNNAAPDETTTNGYSLIDFSVGGNIKLDKHLASVVLSVNNIFDITYIDHLSTLKEVGYYNPGRNFTLTIKIPFGIK